MIKIITLAPEQDVALSLTRYCKEHHVVVSIGHSAATYQETCLALANGAQSMTHVFNGMPAIHHRNINLSGTALRFHEVYGEMIGDGNHVSIEMINEFFHAKGKDYGIMITDSLSLKGMPTGTKGVTGGNPIVIGSNGSAYLEGQTVLAGSTLRMNEGLRRLVEEAMVPFDTALNSCTCNPARLLRVDERKGSLGVGYDADLVILNDDYSIEMTYVKGRKAIE